MRVFEDREGRPVRFTEERLEHLLASHPEMHSQLERIAQTPKEPDRIVRPWTDREVELSHRQCDETPVTRKFLCAVVKGGTDDRFLVTAYFTDGVKRGEELWRKP